MIYMSAWLKDHTLLCFSFHFFDLSFSSSLLASRLAVGFERLLLCFGQQTFVRSASTVVLQRRSLDFLKVTLLRVGACRNVLLELFFYPYLEEVSYSLISEALVERLKRHDTRHEIPGVHARCVSGMCARACPRQQHARNGGGGDGAAPGPAHAHGEAAASCAAGWGRWEAGKCARVARGQARTGVYRRRAAIPCVRGSRVRLAQTAQMGVWPTVWVSPKPLSSTNSELGQNFRLRLLQRSAGVEQGPTAHGRLKDGADTRGRIHTPKSLAARLRRGTGASSSRGAAAECTSSSARAERNAASSDLSAERT